MRRTLPALLVGALLAVVAVSADAQGSPPSKLGDLIVKQEDVAKVIAADPHQRYGTSTILYSLRTPANLLEGTLQITKLKPGTPWQNRSFQLSMLSQFGSTVPVAMRVGGYRVYLSSMKGLVLTVWFRDSALVVLSIRDNYKQPKTVLRDALAVQP